MRVFNKDMAKTEIGGVGGSANEVNYRRMAYAYTSNRQLVMNDKYDYVGWVTRCGFCYHDDLKASGKRAVDYCKKQKEQIGND